MRNIGRGPYLLTCILLVFFLENRDLKLPIEGVDAVKYSTSHI